MPASVKAVLFDAVGTLIEPRPSVAEAYQIIGQRHGSALSLEQIRAGFAAALRECAAEDHRQHNYQTSETREHDRWRTIVRVVFTDLPSDTERGEPARADRLFDDLWQHFAAPENWSLFDDVAGTWQRLAGGGLTLGVASNFDRRLLAIGEALAPLDTCEHWFVSSRTGHRKPGRAFFAAIEQQLGLSGDELLLVGDDVENDYLAARAAGWQALHLARDTEYQDARVPAEQTIARLDELVTAIGI